MTLFHLAARSALLLAFLIAPTSSAADMSNGADVVGLRLSALDTVKDECLPYVPHDQGSALFLATQNWYVRNSAYVESFRVFYALMAADAEKTDGSGQSLLGLFSRNYIEQSAKLKKSVLSKASTKKCEAAISQIDGGALDVATSGALEDADALKDKFGSLVPPGQRLRFDLVETILKY